MPYCRPSIVDHPIIQKLFPDIGNRFDLSNLCSEVSAKIQTHLKIKLQSALHIAIAIDEWTDQCNRRYLGIQGICIFTDTYEIFTLAQSPIFEVNATANVLASIVKQNLKNYGIEMKTDYMISDTTPVMPATASLLNLKWSPCYCHVLNLVAGDFTKCISMIVSPILEIQKKLGRSTLFTQYCIQKKSKIFSIPMPTETRWYSYYSTLYAIKQLKNIIIEFLQIQKKIVMNIDDSLWEDVECLFDIYNTFRIAFNGLESDKFGTKSLVISGFRMIQKNVYEKDYGEFFMSR